MTRVLVARLDSAGDVLLAGPAVRAVAASGADVTFLAGPRGAAAAALLPGIDEILVHRAAWIDPEPEPVDPTALAALVEQLSVRRLDEALVLVSFHQSPLPLALLLRLAGVPRVAAICEDYPGSLLDVRHRVADDLHEVERGLSLAAACGHALPDDDDGRLALRPVGSATPLPAPYVVVHPGASVTARAPEPDTCRALVRLLAADGLGVAVTGGAGEEALCGYVAGATHPRVVDCSGRTSLAGLAGVLAGADAVVVGNTGPAHLAAAVGTPVVSLFAPTVPLERWRPWGVPCEALFSPVPCAGCRARVCPVEGHPCLGALDPLDIAAAVRRLTAKEVVPA